MIPPGTFVGDPAIEHDRLSIEPGQLCLLSMMWFAGDGLATNPIKPSLLAIARLLGSDRSEVAQQAIGLIIRTGGEVEVGGQTIVRRVSTKAERP
jgi:hypothetical protein